jgi:metallo-beta-lactamase family protein
MRVSHRTVGAVKYGETRRLARGVEVVFHDAGHILGSAVLALDLEESGTRARESAQ